MDVRSTGRLTLFLVVCVLALGLSITLSAEGPVDTPQPQPEQPEMSPEEKADAELGKAAAEEVEKRFTIVKDSPAVARVQGIIEKLRPATEKPHQQYEVKVIESKALNAFALPGGYLYMTEGILDAVESEDELAAVAAHEMAHVCLNHSRKLMSKDERYAKVLTPIILASVLTQSRKLDPGQIALVGSLLVQDAINHYGREAELEADRGAVRYLHKSESYNPVAVLTVVEGLARFEAAQATGDMGVFQTHPLGKVRVAATIAALNELGIPLERRRVTNSLAASAATVVQDNREIGELRLNGRVVFRPAVEVDGSSPAARAQRSAEVLNSLLLANLQLLEINLIGDEHATKLAARGETILTITAADAEFHGTTVEHMAEQAMAAIRLGFHEEKIQRAY